MYVCVCVCVCIGTNRVLTQMFAVIRATKWSGTPAAFARKAIIFMDNVNDNKNQVLVVLFYMFRCNAVLLYDDMTT
jgi:hypothetical protein